MSAMGVGEPPGADPEIQSIGPIFITSSTTITSSPTQAATASANATTGFTKAEQTGIGIGTTFAAVVALGLGLLLWSLCSRRSVSSNGNANGQETGLLAAPKTRARASISWHAWLWELVALLVGIAAFIAIVIILKVNEHQELSTWTLPISLNTIVSILAAVFKSILALPITEGISQLKWYWFQTRPRSLADIELFDQASRGPWGSVRLIGSQIVRRKRSYSATLGATIIIMLLAVDPFSQATVHYHSCRRLDLGTPNIPSGNTYHTNLELQRDDLTLILDPDMEKAIYIGLFKPPVNSSQSVEVVCATGNCTFPSDQGATFNTLGMCHKCIDQSKLVLGHGPPMLPTDSLGNPYIGTGPSTDAQSPGETGSAQGPQLDPFTVLNTTAGSNQTLPDGPWRTTTLMGFRGLARQYDTHCNWDSPAVANSLLCNGTQYLAFDCAFQACVKTYGANISNGIYTEQVISSQPLHAFSSMLDVYGMRGQSTEELWEVALDRTLVNGTWQDCTPTKEPSALNIVPMAGPEAQDLDRLQPSKNVTMSWYRPECVYNVSGLDDDYFRAIFDNQTLFSDTDPRGIQGAAWFKGVYNHGNVSMSSIDNFAAGLATSMEAYIRGNPSDSWPGRLGVVGQTWTNDSCVEVRWGFLSWLAVLLALELVFFGRLLVSVVIGPLRVSWKSSSLALLFHGLADVSFAEKGSSTTEEMLEIAKSTEVSLVQVDGSYKLVEQ